MELGDLVGAFAAYARFAQEAGFDFVDIKQCHGYLLHEMLSAHTRPGRYGGSFENRTRLFREIVAGIRQHYKPEDLVGRQIVVVNNLEQALLRGEESNGMLLAASDSQGVVLLRPDRECESGSGVK